MNKKDAIKIFNTMDIKGLKGEEVEAVLYALNVLKGKTSKANGGKASKEKGKTGEREWASKCREQGYDAHRGQQYCGANGDADVVGLPGIHSEVKRVEKLNLYDAMSQSVSDANQGEMPIVAHRKNSCNWLVTMNYEDWFTIYKNWELNNS